MKKLALIIALFISLPAISQEFDIIGEMDDDFTAMKNFQESEPYKSSHMLGVKYSYHLSTVQCTPDIGSGFIFTGKNLSLMYTYYNSMWNSLPYFGMTVGLKYGEEGFTSSKTTYGYSYDIIEMPVISEFHIDVSKFRILAGIGGYCGYKLNCSKPEGWDNYDIRYDYGIEAEAGVAMIFKPFELQLKGEYKYSLCSDFHVNKFSDLYWISCYPRNIMISCGLFIHLW